MADDLFYQIQNKIRSPYIFYGHSLGSLLAYEVILRLMDAGKDLPIHAFMSGRGGPGVLPRNRDIKNMPQERFYELLKGYGGTPAQVLQEKEVMAFFEPLLRADFMAAERYCSDELRKIPLALTVFNGIQDQITRDDALNWQEVTDRPIILKEFTGCHFFIFDHVPAICDAICRQI
jgi:surfactin synthase thioesterase subunit